MNCRSGATLVEVLVAMFVMAIGLLSLLALFPVGAFRMAQAIRDGRCAHAAHNALAMAIATDLRTDPLLIDPTTSTDVFYAPPNAAGDARAALPKANPNGPSYPVYVDPLAFATYGIVTPNWVGNTIPAPQAIVRRNVSFVNNAAAAQRMRVALQSFSLLDDIAFNNNGLPALTGANVQRESRFTWALMCRRPRTAAQDVVDMSVVVYENRPLTAGGLKPLEYEYSGLDDLNVPLVTFDLTRNVIKLRWQAANPAASKVKPQLHPGSWILDATTENYQVTTAAGVTTLFGTAHGDFYRVVGVEEITENINNRGPRPALEVQVEPQLRGFATSYLRPLASPPFGANTYAGRAIIMEGVVAVFPVGTGWSMTTRALAMPAGSGSGF